MFELNRCLLEIFDPTLPLVPNERFEPTFKGCFFFSHYNRRSTEPELPLSCDADVIESSSELATEVTNDESSLLWAFEKCCIVYRLIYVICVLMLVLRRKLLKVLAPLDGLLTCETSTGVAVISRFVTSPALLSRVVFCGLANY